MSKIRILDNAFYLETARTCYILQIRDGFAEHLYYGDKIPPQDWRALVETRSCLLVNTLYPTADMTYAIDAKGFEFSLPNRGDSRSSGICLNCDDSVCDFVYDSYRIGACPQDTPMPLPRDWDESLCLTFRDRAHAGLTLECWYLICYDSDVIVRFHRLCNAGERSVDILKCCSGQLDLTDGGAYELVSLQGAWGREMSVSTCPVTQGMLMHGSFSGMSSAECNPMFMLQSAGASETNGDVYACNLMYSGSHAYSVERTPYGGVRILHGMQWENLRYPLAPHNSFMTPASVMTYSSCGRGGASRNMHRFVCNHVSTCRQLPVMLNTWEAFYFDIHADKILALADRAQACGIECMVIDDGWFGARDDDTTSLGDWHEDVRKFPNGIRSVAQQLARRNIKLGIWIEPEMISEQSDLYRAHRDWVLQDDELRPIVGRGQYILDLTKQEVQDHVVHSVGRLAEAYGAGYVKWDFNRRFAEVCARKGSGYFYDYVTGLYAVLRRLQAEHPDLLIENCASGGGRFDLGMMRYTACSWTSDNTNPLSRSSIQQGASFGYPLQVTLNHYAASPGHQTGRSSSVTARIDTALCGVFGIQTDITRMGDEEFAEVSRAVADYKRYRTWLGNAEVYRLQTGEQGYRISQYMSTSGQDGLLYLMREKFDTVTQLPVVRLCGLDPQAQYRVSGPKVNVSASGATLMRAGLRLPQNFTGVQGDERTLMLTDSSTLLLEIHKENTQE